MASDLERRRAFYRARGVTDAVELEAHTLGVALPGDSARMARALRDDARRALSRRATAAEVEAEAIRLLYAMVGLAHPR